MIYMGSGKDGVGEFRLYQDGARCEKCGEEGVIVVSYRKVFLTKYVKEARSLILFNHKGKKLRLGIECGCYAKLHRQVTHIRNGEKK